MDVVIGSYRLHENQQDLYECENSKVKWNFRYTLGFSHVNVSFAFLCRGEQDARDDPVCVSLCVCVRFP